MPEVSPLIRLFVSSTFADFVVERELLQRVIFPQLRTLCAAQGCRFQPIDLRWGVSEAAGNDKRTLTICLEEVARCQRLSPDLNFLILLGERYGSCFLPERIPAAQVARLLPHLPGFWRARFQETYAEDQNASPPEYVLLPSAGIGDVREAEEALRVALAQATAAAGFSESERLPFVASATHLEIQRGLLEAGCALTATLCAFRSFTSVPEGSQAALYVEPQPERRARLAALKQAIEQRLGAERIWRYTAPGELVGPTMSQAAQAHYQTLTRQFYNLLEPRIQEALARRWSSVQTWNRAALANRQFAARASVVVGRKDALARVAAYLAGPTPRPLVVTGASGVGKSTLLVRAVENAIRAHPQAVVVTRYIGITPGTSSLADLLTGLRREIAERYGQAPPEPLGDLSQLVAAVATHLRSQAAPAERPLILIVDALDQVGGQTRRVDWLPPTLAPRVSVIVSVSSDQQELDTLRTWLPAEQILPLAPLTRGDGADILRQWLAAEGRRLTPAQESAVLEGFAPAGASVEGTGTPLYLRLVFEQARTWRSFEAVDPLPPTIPALLQRYFSRLEQPEQHGRELVAYALAYLVMTRHGLAEDELLDLLARSATVRTALRALSPGSPPIAAEHPLPVALWARLAADLEGALTEREADGARLVTFYHQQVRAEAQRRYVSGTTRAARDDNLASYFHHDLAAYFGEQPYRLGEGGAGVWNRRKLAELAYQQAEAGPEPQEALQTTLTDGRFLEGKLTVEGVAATLDDLALSPSDEDIAKIIRAIRAGAIMLANQPTELPNQITGRVGRVARLHDLPERTPPWLRLRTPSLGADPALQRILQGHTDHVTDCALSMDGKLALSASADGTLRLWNTTSGETLRILEGHQDRVSSCALSADGRLALSCSGRELRLWDTDSGRTLHILQGHTGEVTDCALSADGKRALSAAWDKTMRLWDTDSGEMLRILKQPTSRVMGHLLAFLTYTKGSTFSFWMRLRIRWALNRQVIHGYFSRVTSCALSADGQVALSGSLDGKLRLWDTTSGQILHTRSHISAVEGCALSADGRLALCISTNPIMDFITGTGDSKARLQLWDTKSGRTVRALKGFKGAVTSCALSADGRLALSGSGLLLTSVGTAIGQGGFLAVLMNVFGYFDDFEASTLRVWNVASGETQRILKGHRGSVTSCALSGKGELALSASSREEPLAISPNEHLALRLWSVKSKEPMHTQERHSSLVTRCTLSADGSLALTASIDRTLRLWDTASGQTLRILQGHGGPVFGCALSADGRVAVSAARDGWLRLWDTDKGQLLHKWLFDRQLSELLHRCVLSADGRLAFSPRLSTVRLWDTMRGATLITLIPAKKPRSTMAGNIKLIRDCYTLSGDGRRALAVSGDGWLRLWDTTSGEVVRTLVGQAENMSDCALSANGRVAAFTVSENMRLWLWDTVSGKPLHTLESHTAEVRSCALNADGRFALSVSQDRTLRIWDTGSGQEIAQWTHDIEALCCALSADGRVAVTGDLDGGVHFFDIMGVTKTEGAPDAKLAVSWLAEKEPSKPGLASRHFARK